MDDLCRNVSGARVLDLGCGKGEYSLSLLSRGAHVTGVDISDKYVNCAREAAQSACLDHSRFVFKVMDAHALEFQDGSFDLVVGSGILHHLDMFRALDELCRVLKPGGRTLFLEPLAGNPLLKLFRLMTPRARTRDERPLTRGDLRTLAADGRWEFTATYSGLVCAPVAIVTSLLLRPFPNNPCLRLAGFVEQYLNRWPFLRPLNQYVLIEITKRS